MSESKDKTSMLGPSSDGERYELTSPTHLPKASAFLWNKAMMIHMNCRGYAVAQFMQPEPAKYAHAPNLEAKTFMQPEQPYYAHHPGRFFYVKDEENQQVFSAPYEPVRAALDSYTFSAGKADIRWSLTKNDLAIIITLSLAPEDPVELWKVQVRNKGHKDRQISLYPYFPVGYMSWMNQAAWFDPNLNGIICSAITPYQKYEDYPKIKRLKDTTYLLADQEPTAWESNQSRFEGEGGLHAPDGVTGQILQNGEARYETPAAVLQYRMMLPPAGEKTYRFIFGPARDEQEIDSLRDHFFGKDDGFEKSQASYNSYLSKGSPCLNIQTPDPVLDNMVNNWLPRQIYYHGETNRLSTDPQTRNYLQDSMGVAYLAPGLTRKAFVTALSQQQRNGAMPDGILLHEQAELKYINQVPHTDHCVWLPICLQAYLDETNDYSLLEEEVPYADNKGAESVSEHIDKAMLWLIKERDERGLSYINQGDWCDPMNMVGPKGKGVSGWLSMATSYALRVWVTIGKDHKKSPHHDLFESSVNELNQSINAHLWDGNWYARGITDDDVIFGVSQDEEGQIFLNPQGWSLLCGCADREQQHLLIDSVTQKLKSPYGMEMLTPAFTKMREDIGRVTQKHPGSAENGSIYNHAAAFYAFGLYANSQGDEAFEVLRKMIPGPEQKDLLQRGQLPVFIPNYYRGAFRQFPNTAGRSSQLFNTGTVHWFYRCLIDGLFGLRGTTEGLIVCPQLPSHWKEAHVTRRFRGATLVCQYERKSDGNSLTVTVDGKQLESSVITNIEVGKSYDVNIALG